MPDLKPCPFCGSDDAFSMPTEISVYEDELNIAIACGDCGARGPDDGYKCWDSAASAWNSRAIAPAEAARVLLGHVERDGYDRQSVMRAMQDVAPSTNLRFHAGLCAALRAIAGDDTAPDDAT